MEKHFCCKLRSTQLEYAFMEAECSLWDETEDTFENRWKWNERPIEIEIWHNNNNFLHHTDVTGNKINRGSLEKHASTVLTVHLCKTTKMHLCMQFTVASINTSISKTPTTLIPFRTNYDYRSKLLINEGLFSYDFLQNTTVCYDIFTIVHDL